MSKPILIDALHICMGGGLMILNHLVTNLVEREVDFVLLKDERCPKLNVEDQIKTCYTLSSDGKTRKCFYKQNRDTFSAILCFGNIPPQIKMSVPVHTYIHNVSLLRIPKDYSLKKKALSLLKKLYIRHYAKNTDTWIVQTSNTANLVKEHLALNDQLILEYPFYYIPADINKVPAVERKDYCFIGDYTSAKGHEYLTEAWIKLAKEGLTPTLHLTVSEQIFLPIIKKAQAEGAIIINHGKVPFNKVVNIYNQSKSVIYPSLNESLGLGILEAVEAGCDVIGADLPYMHSVCVPSVVFQPCNSDAIVEAVKAYEDGGFVKSKLKIRDEVIPFISFLQHNRV